MNEEETKEDNNSEDENAEESVVVITGNAREDMIFFISEGLGVDDDNEPAIENDRRINNSSRNEVEWGEWTGDVLGVCSRMASGHRFEILRLTNRCMMMNV